VVPKRHRPKPGRTFCASTYDEYFSQNICAIGSKMLEEGLARGVSTIPYAYNNRFTILSHQMAPRLHMQTDNKVAFAATFRRLPACFP